MIIIYTKTDCPWCKKALEWLKNHNHKFEERNVTNSAQFLEEVKKATGQDKCPTLNIDGTWVPDASIEDIEEALLATQDFI